MAGLGAEAISALEEAASVFSKAEARSITLPSDFARLRDTLMIIPAFEVAKVLAPEGA